MSSSKSKTKTASFPILGILGLIFVTLKLAEIGVVATWSWWWVLSPFWIPLAIVLGIFAVVAVGMVVAKLLEK
jgi:fatty acid desaturase